MEKEVSNALDHNLSQHLLGVTSTSTTTIQEFWSSPFALERVTDSPSSQIQTSAKDLTSEEIGTSADESQTVHFSLKGWKSKALQVFDSNNNTILYTVDTKFRKPNLVFKHGDDGDKFGTTTYHATSSRIDLEIKGQSVEMKPTKIFGSTYSYSSPVFGNAAVTWKSGSLWKNIDFVLLDEQALPVARCSAPYLSKDFSGKVEFLNSRASNSEAKEEILIGAMSLIYLTVTLYYAAIAS